MSYLFDWFTELSPENRISLISIFCLTLTSIVSSIVTIVIQCVTNRTNKIISRAEHRHDAKATAYAQFLNAADSFLRNPSEVTYDIFSTAYSAALLQAPSDVAAILHKFACMAFDAERSTRKDGPDSIESAFICLDELRSRLHEDLSASWSEPLVKRRRKAAHTRDR